VKRKLLCKNYKKIKPGNKQKRKKLKESLLKTSRIKEAVKEKKEVKKVK